MSIKQRIKSTINKMSERLGKKQSKSGMHPDKNSELGADEVVKKEVYPTKRAKNSGGNCNVHQAKRRGDDLAETAADSAPHNKVKTDKHGCVKKPLSKRTRPTNKNYTMIDPDSETCDTGKS